MTEFQTLAFVLLVVGLVLLVAELFVPSFGVLSVLSVVCIVGGLVLLYLYADALTFLVTLIALFLIMPALAMFSMYYWPRTPLGRYMCQPPPVDDEPTQTHEPGLEKLRGRIGKVLAPLRPAGVVAFDNRRVDVLSEGTMVEAGQWVRCIDVRAGKVIVRPVPGPNLTDLENADFT